MRNKLFKAVATEVANSPIAPAMATALKSLLRMTVSPNLNFY
jgi:hypothetical protein